MCLGLSHETNFKIVQGLSPFDPRNLVRDELLCLSTTDWAALRFVNAKFYVMTISTLPHNLPLVNLVLPLSEVFLRVPVESLLTANSTEVVFLSFILGSSCCLSFLYLHLANWVYSH